MKVKVSVCIDKQLHDFPKHKIMHKLLEAKFLPTTSTNGSSNTSAPVGRSIHVKFHLINVIFSEELHDLALISGNSTTCKELDSGTNGAKSHFWKLVEMHFNDGFPPGVDGIMYTNKVDFNHPLFDSDHEAIDLKNHGKFTIDLLWKMWKDIQSEYDTIMTKFMKLGKHNSNSCRQQW